MSALSLELVVWYLIDEVMQFYHDEGLQILADN